MIQSPVTESQILGIFLWERYKRAFLKEFSLVWKTKKVFVYKPDLDKKLNCLNTDIWNFRFQQIDIEMCVIELLIEEVYRNKWSLWTILVELEKEPIVIYVKMSRIQSILRKI